MAETIMPLFLTLGLISATCITATLVAIAAGFVKV